jgi:uncharacterized protein (DUF1501 family)
MARFPKTSLNRRQFLKGVGAACLATALPARAETTAPFFLLVYASGGWDPTMVFDPKTDSSYVSQEAGWAKATGAGNVAYVDHPDRPAVKAFFESYGKNAAIVNGITSGSMDKTTAIRNMFGAVPKGKHRPVDWLTYYTVSTNPVCAMPHTVIDAPYLPGEYTSAVVRLTSKSIDEYTSAIPNAATLGATGETALAAFRKNAYAKFYQAAASDSLDSEKLVALRNAYAREPLMTSGVNEIETTLGAPGADSTFVRHGKMAVELFATGRSQAVSLQAGRDDLWDTSGGDHFAIQSQNYQDLFEGLNSILGYAQQRGIASKLTVMVMSERGRAPLLNAAGGKSPWAFTSVLLWGAGIASTVVGTTDPALRGQRIEPIFGTAPQGGKGGVLLEVGHIMAAYYLKTNVPGSLILPNYKPLAPILAGDE